VRKQQRKIVGGDTDAPAGKHPDEPEMVRPPVKIDRGEKADHQDEDAEVDDESPHGAILRHVLNFLPLRLELSTRNPAVRFTGGHNRAG
jgi:hypothetical protein